MIYGDVDLETHGIKTIGYIDRSVENEIYDASLFVGDMCYDIPDENYRKGDRYLQRIQSFTTKIPHMVSLGNHDLNSV